MGKGAFFSRREPYRFPQAWQNLRLNLAFDSRGKLQVLRGHLATGRMGAKPDTDLVVDVRPFGMVVHRLRFKGDADHEGDRVAEALEFKRLLQGVPAVP